MVRRLIAIFNASRETRRLDLPWPISSPTRPSWRNAGDVKSLGSRRGCSADLELAPRSARVYATPL